MLDQRPVIRNEKGMTLVELGVYMAIMVVVLAGSYTVYEGAQAIYLTSSGQADAQRYGRSAQALMTKHLRMTETFQTANDYDVKVRVDIDDDDMWNTVRYYVDTDTNTLYKEVDGGNAKEIAYGVINDDLSEPLFKYYDLTDAEITTDTASRKTKTNKMVINLKIDEDTTALPPVYTLTATVALRNND